MKYSVVIVTYNRLNLLKECLEHVNNQKLKFSEIIIVNNASNDGTTEFLTNYNNIINTKIINLPKNIGGAGGFNTGIKNLSTDYDYVLLIDDDAMIDENYIYNINENIEKDVYAYSGTVIKANTNCIDLQHRRRIKNLVLLKNKLVDIHEYNNKFFYYDIASFCGILINKCIIEKIGLPIKDYFIWYDDTEYSFRMRKYTKIKNVNEAFLIHKDKNNVEKRITWKSYYGYRNMIDCGKKHSKRPGVYLIYIFLYFFKLILKKYIKYIFNRNKYLINEIKLIKKALHDGLNNKLGISDIYYPGWKSE